MYTSADLLQYFNDLTGRPAGANDVIPDTSKYVYLARAEKAVITEVATVAPWVLYQKVGGPSLPTLFTADHNVFTFGNGTSVAPIGRVQIYRLPTDIPDNYLVEGFDYVSEGDQIRFVRGRTQTTPLYWRGIQMPADIDANTNPHLVPSEANELTAIKAAIDFAETGERNSLADRLERRYQKRFAYWCLTWRQQFKGGGALLGSRSLTARDLYTPFV